METQLTAQDIELLLEAVESWEVELGVIGMLGSVMMASGESEEAALGEARELLGAALTDMKHRKRHAILLKAKLITMQDEVAPDQLFRKVKVGEEKDG